MGIWQAPKISAPPNTDNVQELRKYVKELANIVAMMAKDLDFTINGNMDSRNTREIGGYNVDLTELKSKAGTVGISSYKDPDPDVDDVRFWAGDVDKNAAPWRVTEEGKMFATGAKISSSSGYPRVEIDPDTNIITAYYDATNYISMRAAYGGTPAITLTSPSNTTSLLQTSTDAALQSSQDLSIASGAGSISITPGISEFVKFVSFYTIYSSLDGDTLGNMLQSLSDRITALGG